MRNYIVTKHAIERAYERLGISRKNAAHHLNQLMQTAFYQGETQDQGSVRKIYDHHKSRTRIFVEDNHIITVYKFPEEAITPQPTLPYIDEISQLIKRKFAKSEREFKRKERTLSIELAEFNLELATLRLNFAKAKSPKVRTNLVEKISEVETKAGRIQFELDEATKSFNAIKEGAAAYL
ncbi:hypothetical protein [Cytobacillus purgationiresistens]|uniref:Mobilization protein n=1 Tax=Cytobacillus purgationiresistens TaxID=863449 RepID=A0ABU0AHP1_9BACI|nr:hypothetical protein [Cytobacillus purgationiresistens]MDQ0270775.1 hypothetical protein [Cytobacillus purgationiresistens]